MIVVAFTIKSHMLRLHVRHGANIDDRLLENTSLGFKARELIIMFWNFLKTFLQQQMDLKSTNKINQRKK